MPLRTFFWMPLEFILVNKEGKAKITNIQTFSMIFMRQSCEIPCFEPMFAEMDGLNRLNLGLIQEYLHFSFLHAMILVIEHVLFFFFELQSECSFFFFSTNQALLIMYLLGIDQNKLLCNPSIKTPINSKVMHVVLIPHGLLKLLVFLIELLFNLVLDLRLSFFFARILVIFQLWRNVCCGTLTRLLPRLISRWIRLLPAATTLFPSNLILHSLHFSEFF